MKKITLLLFAFGMFSVYAQQNSPWQSVEKSGLQTVSKVERTSVVNKFDAYALDLSTFKSQLQNAPLRGVSTTISTHITYFPNAEGEIQPYRIYEAPVMHKDLQVQFPDIKSYVGVAVNDKFSTVRFSTTRFGVHAMILSPKGTVYIDPYTADLNHYMVYRKKDAVSSSSFECLTADSDINTDKPAFFSPKNAYDIESNTGIFRTYRLGLACTVEYAQYHINLAGVSTGTVAERDNAVLSAMNVTMTRVNGLFERDMSLTMVIVPNNTNVIFFLPEKPDALTNSSGSSLINEIQPIMNAGIGAANYDIGHVFSTGGGGIAQLNSPCSANKARGVTGQGNPIGDPFDVDYVAHEMGHQYGATHTQNNNCNRTGATAVEPGSATTILGYAGICAPNVQNNSDDHFHAVSMAQMDVFVAGSGNCSVNISNNNNAPVIQPIPNYTVPRSTPLILPGNATDADGDALTYCWEQIDNQVSTQPPVATATGGPNFRSLSPQTNPDRYLPSLTTVLTGATANTWEVIPSVNRTMNFALTVRDNELVNGGQTARANMVVTTNAAAGPFVVNSPNTNVSWLAGSNQTITWDVAGTTANGINTPLVDIYLSTNGGTSFPTLVASNVPNDGSETITIPNSEGNQNRIMVRGDNHIFYDVSNTNFTIATTTPTFSLAFNGQADGQNKKVCQGQSVDFEVLYGIIGGFSGTTTLTASGQPSGTNVLFSQNSLTSQGSVTMSIEIGTNVSPGLYLITVTGTSGTITKSSNFYIEIVNGSFALLNLTNPVNFANGVSNSVTLSWDLDIAATNYDIEVATDIDFNNVIVSTNVLTNNFTLNGLTDATNYFWRVRPKNAGCQGEMSLINRFTTSQTACSSFSSTNVPITIPTSTATVNSTLVVPSQQNQIIQNITVNINVTHTWINDLIITLISPQGTQVRLVNRPCANSGSFQNINAVFSTEGITLVCATIPAPAISGTIIPNQSFSAFTGQNSQGTWTLRVQDAANGDGGSINSWSLNFCETNTAPLPCGTITSIWNGNVWSNGRPVDNMSAIVNENLIINQDLKACSFTVNNSAQVTVQSGNNLIIENEVVIGTSANLTIENNANLIQISNAQNTGSIAQNRSTSPLMRLDYAMWSSPVTGSQSLLNFSPLTVSNRFYTYLTNSNIYSAISNPATVSFEEGKGYLIRMPDNHPTTPTIWTGTFNGVPKNGDIEVDLGYISATQKFNAIGNPYPSTINAEQFLLDNQTTIEGTLYFWRKTNNAPGTAYATYTLGGATTTSPTSPVPNGTIQVGQGFIVAARNVANPSVLFTNELRVDNNNNQFFRSSFGLPYVTQSNFEKHRIWLNLTNAEGLFSQMMVGYMENATNGVDELIDGKYIGDFATAMTSIIDQEEYIIQGKALPFETSDIVPLRFKTEQSGTFSFAIDNVDGLFEGDQVILIRDELTNTIHNLKEAPFVFTSEPGTFSNRFQLLFDSEVLSTIDFIIQNQVVIAVKDENIKLKSTHSAITEIEVHDVLGRKLSSFKKVNNNEFSINSITPSLQTLLVKVKLDNGEQYVKKIIF